MRDRSKTLAVLTEEFNNTAKIPVSYSVVNRALHSWSLRDRFAARKPLLSRRNIIKRLAFAKKHVKWTKKNVDESSVYESLNSNYLDLNEEDLFVDSLERDLKKECLVQTVKYGGGSVMVWGGICVNGVTPLKRIVGIMDKKNVPFHFGPPSSSCWKKTDRKRFFFPRG